MSLNSFNSEAKIKGFVLSYLSLPNSIWKLYRSRTIRGQQYQTYRTKIMGNTKPNDDEILLDLLITGDQVEYRLVHWYNIERDPTDDIVAWNLVEDIGQFASYLHDFSHQSYLKNLTIIARLSHYWRNKLIQRERRDYETMSNPNLNSRSRKRTNSSFFEFLHNKTTNAQFSM